MAHLPLIQHPHWKNFHALSLGHLILGGITQIALLILHKTDPALYILSWWLLTFGAMGTLWSLFQLRAPQRLHLATILCCAEAVALTAVCVLTYLSIQ